MTRLYSTPTEAVGRKNVIVIGGSYVGYRAAQNLAEALPSSHRVILLEKNSHFQHLFAFPRFAVVAGFEHKAFIPYKTTFSNSPPDSGIVIRAKALEIHKTEILLDRDVEVDGVLTSRLPWDGLVLATGTKLTPPGSLETEEKLDGIKYFRRHQTAVEKANRIVVLGGGAVGVQLAADIADVFPSKTVTLVHSRKQLMNRFHPELHDRVMKTLKDLKVETVLGDRAVVPSDGFPTDGEVQVELYSGRKLSGDLAIVCTGQQPLSDPIRTLSPSSIDDSKFIRTLPTLQIADPQFPKVFAIGDIAATGAPKAARPGFVQAAVATRNLVKLITNSSEPLETYTFDPAAIHLTLGIIPSVVFRNPASADASPTIIERVDGALDMAVENIWKGRSADMSDFWA